MKLRWYKRVREWQQWDSREDDWVTRRMEETPVLQYYDETFELWFEVETKVEIEQGPS